MKKYKIYLLFLLITSFSLASYEIGDTLSIDDQNIEFSICYGNEGNLSLSDYNGQLNGGSGYITLIDVSASWCGPCIENNDRIEFLEELYHSPSTPNFATVTALNDIIPSEQNNNLTCEAYGEIDQVDSPLIIEDNYVMNSWFGGDGSTYPLYALLNENMEIIDFPTQSDIPLFNFCPVIYEHLYNCGQYCNSSYSNLGGDTNNDFIVDILDIITLLSAILSNIDYNCSIIAMGDFNGDQALNIQDIIGNLNLILDN